MSARLLAFLVVAAVALAGCSLPAEPAQDAGLPRVMAALGDSITRGVNIDASAPGEHPEASWATGNASFLDNASHRQRLLDAGALEGGAHNLARSGARVGDLARQAEAAVSLRAEYVIILIGANDACGGTSEEAFRAGFNAASQMLRAGLPDGATVFVASIPNLTALWDIHKDNPRAQAAWQAFRVCPPLLSRDATDEERAAVAARVLAYNDILRQESATFGFAFDGGAVHDELFERGDVSNFDYFHPSFTGQRKLADVTWNASPLRLR